MKANCYYPGCNDKEDGSEKGKHNIFIDNFLDKHVIFINQLN